MKFFSVCLVFVPLRSFWFFSFVFGVCVSEPVFFDFGVLGFLVCRVQQSPIVFNIGFSVPLLFLFFCVFGACWATRFFAVLGCSLAVRFADIAKQQRFAYSQNRAGRPLARDCANPPGPKRPRSRIVTRHASDRDILVPVVFRICGFFRPLRFLAGRAPAQYFACGAVFLQSRFCWIFGWLLPLCSVLRFWCFCCWAAASPKEAPGTCKMKPPKVPKLSPESRPSSKRAKESRQKSDRDIFRPRSLRQFGAVDRVLRGGSRVQTPPCPKKCLSFSCFFLCLYVCMYVCLSEVMNVCMYDCMYVCTYVCMYVCMFACMYVCMYVRTYICM